MVKAFLDKAKAGQPVFIYTVNETFKGLADNDKHDIACVLTLIKNDEKRLFRFSIPKLSSLKSEETIFVEDYLWAEVYNILSSLGGKAMHIYIDKSDMQLLQLIYELSSVFCINQKRAERIKYGRAVNVIDRMLSALIQNNTGFKFDISDISELDESIEPKTEEQKTTNTFVEATTKLEGKLICGMDIGGTDIKTVLVKDGHVDCYKEYDWFPAKFKQSSELIDPICLIVRLLRAKASLDLDETFHFELKNRLNQEMIEALDREADIELMEKTVKKIETEIGDDLTNLDAIGLCFPDVVVQNKIVGGEVYKTRGMRNNPEIDYEQDFRQLTDLNIRLLDYVKKTGVVEIINDGPMAAFTAAVEIAAVGDEVENGIFAHTLGTELGTGWVTGDGGIPDIPLEVYNFIIDLGSFVERNYPSDDLRSINNFNTELPGTLQKYCSQSGVFRLALKYFPIERPGLFQELLEKGYVVQKIIKGVPSFIVPTEPVDLRKPFLEHMMALPERENDDVCDRIWKEIGQFIAVTWIETEKILRPKAKDRILFGRLVKNKRCFELIREGASEINEAITLMAANDDMANTELMKQLEQNEIYTVAQFAQAIGAIYYANLGLNK